MMNWELLAVLMDEIVEYALQPLANHSLNTIT